MGAKLPLDDLPGWFAAADHEIDDPNDSLTPANAEICKQPNLPRPLGRAHGSRIGFGARIADHSGLPRLRKMGRPHPRGKIVARRRCSRNLAFSGPAVPVVGALPVAGHFNAEFKKLSEAVLRSRIPGLGGGLVPWIGLEDGAPR